MTIALQTVDDSPTDDAADATLDCAGSLDPRKCSRRGIGAQTRVDEGPVGGDIVVRGSRRLAADAFEHSYRRTPDRHALRVETNGTQ